MENCSPIAPGLSRSSIAAGLESRSRDFGIGHITLGVDLVEIGMLEVSEWGIL